MSTTPQLGSRADHPLGDAPIPPSVHEWPWPNVGRGSIINRSIGSPPTVNIMFTFPNPQSLDTDRLSARIIEVQKLWPLLCITVADQRTVRPKIRYDHSIWDADRILVNEIYDANPNDPQADRNAVFDKLLRSFRPKIAFDSDPLWAVYVARASSDAENHRLYLALVVDHVFIDGRGAVRLANALVADDISDLPKEDIELYKKVGLGQYNDQVPPYSYVASTAMRNAAFSALPTFAQRWLGNYPVWPRWVKRPTIDCQGKSSIIDIPIDLIQKVKEVGKRNGMSSINATMHSAWMVTLWALFIRPEKGEKQMIRDLSMKDLRDESKGDPYCLGGHVSIDMWTSGPMTDKNNFWTMTRSYASKLADPRSAEEAIMSMRMMNLRKDGPLDPENSRHRAPDSDVAPVGDKRAHTLLEEATLERINSLSPYGGISGIWSNMSFCAIPDKAIGLVSGILGSPTGPAFNTILTGHKGGCSIQNAYSDGAAMSESDVKKAEKLFVRILEHITLKEDNDWSLGGLIKAVRPKL